MNNKYIFSQKGSIFYHSFSFELYRRKTEKSVREIIEERKTEFFFWANSIQFNLFQILKLDMPLFTLEMNIHLI